MNGFTIMQINQDLNGLYDTLNLTTVIQRSLNYLSTKVDCENVIWILAEEAESMQKMGARYKFQSKFDPAAFIYAQTPLSTMEISRLYLDFAIDKNSIQLYSQGFLTKVEGGKVNTIFPIIKPETQDVISYVIFTNIHQQKQSASIARAREILSFMKKHFTFCVDHYKVREQSFVDDVTDLYNQRYLPLVLDKEIARVVRSQEKFAVLFLDIDYFKFVNDTCGHLVGSQILVEMAQIIQSQIRTNDFAFRYGGDEFVVILTQTTVDKAQAVAERIRLAVEQKSFVVEGGPADLKLTVSIGLAGFPDHAKTSQDIIQLADDAMYFAKSKSRNTVYVTAS